MKKKLMALMLSGVLVLQSAGMAYGADFSDETGVEVYGDFEEFSDSDGNIPTEEPFTGGLNEEQKVQEEIPEENEQDAESAIASLTSGTCGKNLKWELDNGTLTISGKGEMQSYMEYGYSAPWFSSNIRKVVITSGVISIGDYAFKGCSSLTSITIPGSVTSIGYAAFYGCSSLTSITIPSSVTNIKDFTFKGCSSLTSITIPSSVTSIGNAFYECSSLTSITIPSSVTNIEDYAFYGCSSLTSVTIPSSVTSIGGSAFYGCSNLISITIPSSVTSIGSAAFYGCSSLMRIIIPSGVTNIKDSTFYGCSSLTSITIPSSVTSIGAAFERCSSLKSITIPSSVTNIKDSTFYGCNSLTSITIPSSVTSIGVWAFYGCSSLTSITIPNSVTSIGRSAFTGCSGLASITIPSSVTSIGDYVFSACSSLNSITILSSVTSIGERSFSGCSSLTNIMISSSVTSIEDFAFDGCSSLTDVYYEGSEVEWKKISISYNNGYLIKAKIHYNSFAPSYDKKFSLKASNGAVVFGKENALFVDYEASANGKADSEGKQIKWESSNPSVAEIDQKSTGLIVSQDGSSGSGWINLLTYDVGKTVITGTSVDGRKASVEVEVEPELSSVKNSINISKETLVTLCSVKLERANKNYLESFMKGLKATSKGAVTVRDIRYIISEDGKSAEFSGYVNMIGTEEGYVICTSKGGQTVKLPVGEAISSVDSLTVKAAFGDKSYKKDMHWTKDGYNEGELEVSVQICAPSNSVHLNEISVELKNLKMFKVKDASKVTNIGSDYTYSLNMDQGIDAGKTIIVKLTLTKKGLTWWKPDDGNVHSGEIIVNINGNNEKGSVVSGGASLDVSYQNDLKKAGADDEEKAEQQAQKDADKFLTETVNAFVNLSDKMVLDPKIETYLGHNQFEALKLLIYSEIAMANISKEYFTSSGLSDAVAEKIMAKFLGYEKPKFGIANKRVPIEVVVQGLNNQLYQFSFDCDVSVYSYDGDAFGINGSINTNMWRVSKPNQKQEKISCSTGMINEADLDQFTQSLWKVAESSIKSAYKEIWGSDADKVANEIMEGCIDSIASKAAKYGLERPIRMALERIYTSKFKDNFSSGFFELLIYPSKKAVIKCPVDVYVYNSGNVLVGSIISGKVSILGDGVVLWTVGDDKYVQLFDDTYRLVYKSTDTGTMDISIYDQMANNYNYRDCEFIQLPLKPNVEYTQSINNEFMTNAENYKVDSNEGKVIRVSKEQDLYKTITIIETPTPVPTQPAKPTVTPIPTPTSIPTKKPATPKLEKVTSSYNAISFKWTAVSSVDGYQVFRKVNSGKWKSVKTTTGLVYKDKDTKAGYKYCYTVKAYKLIDGKKVYSGYDKKGLSGKLNTTVSLKTKNNTVSVSWKKTNGASGYYIYRATSKKGKYSKIKTITSGKTLKYTDKKVKKGKTYYYKVVPFRKISGKAVKGASSAVKSIAFKKKDAKPTGSQSSAWKYPEAAQKLIDYLIKNGQEWTDSSNGTNYMIISPKVGNGSVTLQYQKARGDQKSMLWMAYSVNEEINSQNREVITLSWCEAYQLDNSKGEISVNYRINNNNNSVEGKMAANDFTKETNVRFYSNNLKDYTLEQMSEKGNKLLQEALPLFESCLKKEDSSVTMKDLGFKNYNFH